ncbi:MAG TPA: Uma2 family endonuclease [Kofleriaceae bacterium]
MVDLAAKLARYEDLLRLDEDVRAEILGGSIVVMPSPRPRHSKPQRALGRFVGGPFDDDDGFGGPGGWWIFIEVDIELGPHDVVRPDLSGWRRARLPAPDQRPIRVVPNWVCEVISPSTGARDRVTKRQLYARHGIERYWLVDPVARTLEALALRDGTWMDAGTFDETATARIAPFQEIELPVGRLFLPRAADAADDD